MDSHVKTDPRLLEGRWLGVLHELERAARLSGRSPGEVSLIAVSKFHPAQMVAALAELGQKDFGENYMQEAMGKQTWLRENSPDLSPRWHAIGHIQTNKARDAAGKFDLIHTLSSLKLASALARHLEARQDGTFAAQRVLIQVNIGLEPQKSGVMPDQLPVLLENILGRPELRSILIQGLMCLPPNSGQESARPYFAGLRALRDGMERRFGIRLPHLSMGMSGDFPQAVAEGSTFVRVGTAIFGERA